MIQKVQVFLYFHNAEVQILLLRRPPTMGGLWQPVTGTVEPEDRSLEEAALRELKEETGVSNGRIINTGYSFQFGSRGRQFEEHVWGVEAPGPVEIVLSTEHCEYRWTDPNTAFDLMTWESNREGLRRILALIPDRPPKLGS